ncbi:MAG TPA: trehalose-phosphatase, partial [Arenibacter sp.]|nr:trehalose-phosphatase [Arenibacter sp.]
SANEMNESLLINPNDFEEIADALYEAINMSTEEQQTRIFQLQKRLKRYNVDKWANDFLTSLLNQKQRNQLRKSHRLSNNLMTKIGQDFKTAKKRLLFLDYDGTLVGFHKNPQKADPDDGLYALLDKFSEQKNTDLYLISGRDKETFTKWFLPKKYNMIVEHGVWMSKNGKEFKMLENVKKDWMEKIYPILDSFVDRTPGSFIEEKNFSLAWHYRNTDPDFGQKRATELNNVLTSLIANDNLSVLNGNKVMEVKNSNVNKGHAAMRVYSAGEYDFVFAIGDDWTDESMFQELPRSAITVKVGRQKTQAMYYVDNIESVRELLRTFIE